jgi:hypothetical protein
MARYICRTCGVQYAESETPPESCAICNDERQYVGWQGQRWTTLVEMASEGYTNSLREEEPGLWSIGTRPAFAIGQHALLVRTPAGNVLWDCISFVDDASVAAVRQLGGIAAIAISHPHFYGSCAEWSEAFGDAPIYLHEADREWTMHPHPSVVHWTGEMVEPVAGTTLVRLGGHFDGAAVLHWQAGARGKGALLVGDTLMVVMDRRFVSFMYSFPNLIPLAPDVVKGIARKLEPFAYDRIYGAWAGRVVTIDGPDAVERSVQRYIERITEADAGGGE